MSIYMVPIFRGHHDCIKQVMEVVGEQLGKEGEVTMTSNFIDDLDADSLDTVELIMSLEEKFEVSGSTRYYVGINV